MAAANEIATLVANIALALSLIVALVFGIAQVRAAARDRRERLTLEALRGFQSREFAGFIRYISNDEVPRTYEAMLALPAAEHVEFIQFAQQMESLGIAVADDLINLDLVDKTLGSFVVTAWEKYKPVFLDLRLKTDDPYTGEYFQWLAEKIARRMAEHPRPPFYQTGPAR
jgi:hypothetical protein